MTLFQEWCLCWMSLTVVGCLLVVVGGWLVARDEPYGGFSDVEPTSAPAGGRTNNEKERERKSEVRGRSIVVDPAPTKIMSWTVCSTVLD